MNRWAGVLLLVLGAMLLSSAPASATSHDTYVDLDLDGTESGLWLTRADGTVEVRGPVPHFGHRPGLLSEEHVVALASTPDGDGYWLFTNKGNVFAFGAAVHHGDFGHLALAGDIVDAVATTDGGGYYLIGADGGIFTAGNAVYHGSVPEVLPGVQLDAPIVAISAMPGGYVLVAGDGGTFTFGTADYHGSIPQILPGVSLASQIVGIVPGSSGYLMLGGDGGIFNFGTSQFHGSLSGVTADRVAAVAVKSDLSGYLILDDTGNVWPLGDAREVGVETFTGSGAGSVPFSSSDPMIVQVEAPGGVEFIRVHAVDDVGTLLDVVADDLTPSSGHYFVHSPAIRSLDVITTGSWVIRIMPITYALQWRPDAPISGTTPDVIRMIKPLPGSTLLVGSPEDFISVHVRDSDGIQVRHMGTGGGAGFANAVLPTWSGPSILSMTMGNSWSFEVVPQQAPRTVDVTGDSVAITMEINFPNAMVNQLTVRDSAIEGCGVIDEGSMISGNVIRRGFSVCSNFASRWAASVSAHNPEITLVVLGAWEVFDLYRLGSIIPFGSVEHDAILAGGISEGVEALLATGTEVALMEVPCQYPRSGGGLTPLPERGDFTRTAHLNDLLRAEAASHSQVHFITSPPEFCDDPAIGDNPALRWDGTHYGPAGGTFVWNHIRDQLLGLP